MPLPATAVDWPSILTRLLAGADLDRATIGDVMSVILAGDATPAQIAGFLVALRAKGVATDELDGLLDGALAAATFVPLDDAERAAAVDIVGTGGDLSHSINVSTISSLIMAGAGASVCKHGNRSASSKCGSADLLEALGVTIELSADGVATCIREAGIGFCFAAMFHPAFRHVGPARREIGIPTVFNLLGPMANPGRVGRQLIGVADPRAARPMIEALRHQGRSHAWVVHGDGLDELTTTATSQVLTLADGSIESFVLDPAQYGIARATPADLRGGDPADNARAARLVLAGEAGPHRDICLLNAGAGLVVAGVAGDLTDGIARAGAAIDTGAADAALERLVAVSGDAARA